MHAIPSQREAWPVHVIRFEYAHIITVEDRRDTTGNSSDVASWYYLVSFQSIRKWMFPHLITNMNRDWFPVICPGKTRVLMGSKLFRTEGGGRLRWLVYPELFNWGQTSVENTWRHVEHRFHSRFILTKHMAWGETNKPLIFDLYKMRVNNIKIQFKSIVNSALSQFILSGL